ncbi:MAG: PKD domain-containing protein, partial [Bacteroidia bacterium]
MKGKLTLPSIMIGGACILFLSGAAVINSTGYAYATGSPSDGMDCSSCHSGGATLTTATITASPAFGGSGNNLTYTPGATYTVTVKEGGYSLFGFDVEIMNSNSSSATTNAGTMTALANCAINGTGPTNITHTSPISSGSSATFKWVAPASGNAYLYCSVNGVNGNGRTTGDNVKLVSYTLTPASTGSAPVAAFSTASTTVCTGQSLSLTDNSTNSPTSWSWTMTGGTPSSSTIQNPTVTYSTAGTKTITLVATNASGSSSPITKTVTVNATPTVTATSATICNGQAASLQASGATTYSWSSGPTTSSISVNPTSTTVYSVTGTSSGCKSTITSTVTVNPKPTITVNSAAICSGSSAGLTGSGASTYTWSTGSTSNPISVNPTST